MLAQTKTFTIEGLQTRQVTVEVDIRPGLPGFAIVGLADASVREARERVQAAILQLGVRVPGAQDHDEPRSRGRAEDRPGPGSGARLRGAGRERSAAQGSPGGPRTVRRAGARRQREELPGNAGDRPGVRGGGNADARARPRARARGDARARPARSRPCGNCSSAVRSAQRRVLRTRCPSREDPSTPDGHGGRVAAGPERRARPAPGGQGARR